MKSLVLVLLISLAASAQTPNPATDAITARMQEFVNRGEIAGAVTVVGSSQGIVHHDAVGFADVEAKTPMAKTTLFRIASMTKPITAIGIMCLVDEGKLDVNDAVEKHLPEFKGQRMLQQVSLNSSVGTLNGAITTVKPARPITIKDLLTHTSGLPPYPAGFADVYQKRHRTLAETVVAVSQLPLMFEPGTKWSYCNSGIDTLGRIIEMVGGKPYEAFIKERIFDPLGMKNTTYFPTADDVRTLAVTYGKADGKLVAAKNLIVDYVKDGKHPVPAGGLFSTGADIATLYSCLLRGTEHGGKRILTAKSFTEMTTTQTGEIKTGFVDGMSFGYGFAVVVEPKGVTAKLHAGSFGHGGAFGTQSWADPSSDKYYILLIQRTGLANGDASEMRQELQRLGSELK